MQTVNKEEIENFSKDAAHWGDKNGPFKPLHKLNPVRVKYIRDQVCDHFGLDQSGLRPFQKLNILDVGCGGGLLSEPMARLGANTTGLDADANAIAVAKEHAEKQNLSITYLNTSTDELAQKKKKYDVVLALEILEHVDNPALFVEHCFRLCKKNGLVIFSTLNKTAKSYALGIVAAEYILGWVPRRTHDWHKFIKPSALSAAIRQAGGTPVALDGLIYNPLKDAFKMSATDLDVNYFIVAHNAAQTS